MKILKSIVWGFLNFLVFAEKIFWGLLRVCVWMAFISAIFYGGILFSRIALNFPEPFEPKKLVIEQVINIQKQVGCKMIDGEIGPEFKRLVNAQCEIDKPEYFNKLAKPYYTPSGAPKE